MKGCLPRKVGFQQISPPKVLQKIGKNAFRIECPPGSHIHDVVNAAQLERCHTDVFPVGSASQSSVMAPKVQMASFAGCGRL